MSKRAREEQTPPTGGKRQKLPTGCFRLGDITDSPKTMLGKRKGEGGMPDPKRVRMEPPQCAGVDQGSRLPFYPYNEYWESVMLPREVKEVPHFSSASQALVDLRVKIKAVWIQQLTPVVIKLPKVLVSEYSFSSINIRQDVESDLEDRSGVVIYSDKSSSKEEEESEELHLRRGS